MKKKKLKNIKKNNIYKNQNKHENHHNRDHDDQDYEGVKYIEYLFDENNKDYYRPIKTKSTFDNNYIEYTSRGYKNKKLSVKEYLFMIMLDLRELINNHKAPIKLKDPSGEIINNDSFGEWKIQLRM